MEKERFEQGVHQYIKLLSLYLNNKEAKDFVVDKSNISFFARLSKHHSLSALFFKAVESTGAQIDEGYLRKLEESYFLNLRKVAMFNKEREDLYQYLNDKGIDFLPLKGLILKNYYPDENTREFADNDILFPDEKTELVKKFFTKRGYEVEVYKRGNHDVYLKKPCYNFEMHRALFGDSIGDSNKADYFNDYLNRAHVKNAHERELSNEDFFIYFIAHSYKHFNNAGCGIRTLVDFYLYLRSAKLDFNYVNQELEKIGLLDFSKEIINLSKKLFNDEPLTQEEDEMLMFIASSGTYGTLENSVAKGVKEKGKFGYFMQRVFPPYRVYKSMYPWAYKCPILIPVAWTIRLFRIIFKSPKRASAELKTLKNYKEEDEE